MAAATARAYNAPGTATKAPTKPVTALYLRISLDDDNHDVSNSVANQRDLLMAYVAADPVLSAGEVLTFADDGWSGTNFERPQVKALLDLVRRGGVQNILVKDLSRWGRSYAEVSEYLDQIFPFLGVRFISVNDQYDSADHKGQTAPMAVAFSSIVHDMYSKELSVKVSQAHLIRAKKGEYVHGSNFFGYVRCTKRKNRLVIDEGAAITVRLIFDMACDGLSTSEIAARLNQDGVDSPLAHRIRSGQATHGLRPIGGRAFWNNGQILRMLKDERYTGIMVTHKNKVPRPGSNKRIQVPECDWIKTLNAHDAIISAEQFANVQKLVRSNKKTARGISANRSPFVGKIFCGHCERSMPQRTTKNSFHCCNSSKLGTGQGCYTGKIFVDTLGDTVLAVLKQEARKTLELREVQQNQRQSRRQGHSKHLSEQDSIFTELKRLTTNVTLLEQRSLSLYEDFTEGKLNKDAYVAAKTANGADLENTQTRIAELDVRLANINDDATDSGGVSDSALHRVLAASGVNGEVMSLVDRIVIFDGGRIEVRFAFKDTNS